MISWILCKKTKKQSDIRTVTSARTGNYTRNSLLNQGCGSDHFIKGIIVTCLCTISLKIKFAALRKSNLSRIILVFGLSRLSLVVDELARTYRMTHTSCLIFCVKYSSFFRLTWPPPWPRCSTSQTRTRTTISTSTSSSRACWITQSPPRSCRWRRLMLS